MNVLCWFAEYGIFTRDKIYQMTIHKNYVIEANTTKGEEDVRQIETLGWRRYVQNNLFSSFVFYILQSRIEIKQSLDLSVVYSEGRRKPRLIVKYNTAAILSVILSTDYKSSNFLLQQNNLKVKFIFPSTFSLKFY